MILEWIVIIILLIYTVFCIGSLVPIIKGHMKPGHKVLLIVFIIFNIICIFLVFNFIIGYIWIFSVYEENNGLLSLRVVYNKMHKPYSKYPNNLLAYDVSLKTNKKNINKGDTLLIIPRIDVALLESAPEIFSPNKVFIMKINLLNSIFNKTSNYTIENSHNF